MKFRSQDQQQKHMEEHTTAGDRNCNVCKMKFRKQDQQQKHMEEHTTDGDWNCDDCAHQTNSSENLKKHKNNTHHKSQQIKDTSRQ